MKIDKTKYKDKEENQIRLGANKISSTKKFYFLQAHISEAPQANVTTKALSKSAILPTLE